MRLTADRAGAITFSATFDSPQRTTRVQPGRRDGRRSTASPATMRGLAGKVRFLALARAVAERRHASAAPAARCR